MSERLTLWDRLLEYYTVEEALLWLSSPHPRLGGSVPAAMLAREQSDVNEELHRLIDALDNGAYI